MPKQIFQTLGGYDEDFLASGFSAHKISRACRGVSPVCHGCVVGVSRARHGVAMGVSRCVTVCHWVSRACHGTLQVQKVRQIESSDSALVGLACLTPDVSEDIDGCEGCGDIDLLRRAERFREGCRPKITDQMIVSASAYGERCSGAPQNLQVGVSHYSGKAMCGPCGIHRCRVPPSLTSLLAA